MSGLVSGVYQKLQDVGNDYGSMSEKMIEIFETASGMEADVIAETITAWRKSVCNCEEYLNEDGTPCAKEDAKYIWVSTGVYDTKGEMLYMGFVKNNSKSAYALPYFCYYVSTRKLLEKNLEKYKIELPMKPESQQNNLLESIYEMLLVKGDWAALPDYKVLWEVLRLSEARISNMEKFNEQPNHIYNATHTKMAYNTGLVSKYASDIVIIADIDEAGNVTGRRVCQSKSQLRQEGFEKVDLVPISFYKDRRELIFQAEVDDFDLDDIGKLRHIVSERRSRFPEHAQEMSDDEIVEKIKTSIEFDLKMATRNPYWASPFYNINENKIQYLLPLYTGSLLEKPDLAMVISKGKFYYEVRTVLSLSAAYANAACLASPPSAWLSVSEE